MADNNNGLNPAETLQLATDIVAAFVSNNSVNADQLPSLLQEVHDAVRALAAGGTASAGSQQPAVPVKKSVTSDYVICLEDGKKLKMLKRSCALSTACLRKTIAAKGVCRRIIRWSRRTIPSGGRSSRRTSV